MININGEDWKVLLVSSNHPALERTDGSFTIGCCDDILKTIFVDDSLDNHYFKKVLCHELVHACMYSYNVELNDYQEEILADLIATYGQEIIYNTNSIFNRLKQKNTETY